VQLQVVGGGLDPIDLLDTQEENPACRFDDDAIDVFFAGAGVLE
jgi:hypothetical protein